MTWHGQINRTIWEIESLLEKEPRSHRLRREFLRTHFLQRYEYDRANHIPRDDRTFLFLQDQQAPAVLLLHGSAGTPAEMRDLGSFLYGKGYTAYCPRLSRFDIKDRPVTWEAWLTSAENALTTILQYSRRTTVVGLSFGATIALALSRLHPIASMVFLAPAIFPRMTIKTRLLFLARHVTPTLFNRFAGWDGEVYKAMEYVRKNAGDIEVPLLALQAKDDHLLSAKGLKFLEKKARAESTVIELLPSGSHALTRGSEKETVQSRVFEFAQSLRRDKNRRGTRRRGRRGGRGRRRGRPRSGNSGEQPGSNPQDPPADKP
jgi:esterase/lipase